jgi:hypothetical protein
MMKNKSRDEKLLLQVLGGLLIIITILFFLKMIGAAAISWAVVFAPFWIPMCAGMLLLGVTLLLGENR